MARLPRERRAARHSKEVVCSHTIFLLDLADGKEPQFVDGGLELIGDDRHEHRGGAGVGVIELHVAGGTGRELLELLQRNNMNDALVRGEI